MERTNEDLGGEGGGVAKGALRKPSMRHSHHQVIGLLQCQEAPVLSRNKDSKPRAKRVLRSVPNEPSEDAFRPYLLSNRDFFQ